MRVRRALSFAVLALLIVIAGAYGSRLSADETVHLYVGQVEETDAFVAVATDGTRVTAYICDGTPDRVSVWGWFDGELAEGGPTELVATNGLLLQLAAVVNHEEQVTGTVRLRDGTTTSFTADPASGGAGLWRFQGVISGEPVLAGWIVMADGEQRGAVLRAGTSATAGLIDTSTGEVMIGEERVTARHPGGTNIVAGPP